MNKPRVLAIVQARTKSTRLPGKVLALIHGEPMLAWVVDRARLARMLDEVVVATTTDESDDEIVHLCTTRDIRFYRGDPEDVLDRYWNTAETFNADIIVRLTADCPLLDPDLIDETVRILMEAETPVDFVATRLPWERTYPIGLDVEACTREVLGVAWHEANETYQREHVMPFIYENPERFQILLLNADKDYGDLRWTVDTKEDLDFVREIASRLPDRSSFRWRDILSLINEDPTLKTINAGVKHKTHKDVG
jgi:spore coat polysaccharide biosynthesis protein SpsF